MSCIRVVALGLAASLILNGTACRDSQGGADYTLLVTRAIEDLSGDSLTAPASIDFSTQFAGTPTAGIYLAQADGSGVSWLVDGFLPAWSPDGNRLAFNRQGEIYLIDADGSNETRLTSGFGSAWSPDGGTIAFADGSGISVIGVDGTGRTQVMPDSLLPQGYGIGKPVFSPDGQTIAVEHFGSEFLPAQIYLYNRAVGGQPLPVIDTSNGKDAQSGPSWSTDGSRIVFWMFDHGIVMAIPNSASFSSLYQNSPLVGYGAHPQLSPDETRLYFTGYSESNLWADPAGRGLYQVRSNGSNLQLLIPGGHDGALAPDGSRLAFVRGP